MFASFTRNFNSCLFTVNHVPLPLSDEEKLLYHAKNVKFYIKVGEGGILSTYRHVSNSGSLFVTNFRLVYIPLVCKTSFCSFFAPSNSVLDIESTGNSRVHLALSLYGNEKARMHLKIRNSLLDTFIQQLRVSQENMRQIAE